MQLFHGGREQISDPPRPPALAPSPVPSLRFHVEPRALTAGEIEEVVEGYARSAALVAQAGLDGVEVSAAHEYLAAQFFTPGLNRREDEWAEPARFLLAVLKAVRAAAPGLALGVRLSADSDAAQDVVGRVAAHVDYVSVALGGSSTYRGSSGIVPPPPMPENAIAGLTSPFRVGPPLVATSRVVDPAEAGRLVGEGRCDAVGMTRALITDPDLPRKVREGRLDDVLRCIGCNACIAHYHAGTPIACAQNPRTGRELTFGAPPRAASSRRVVIVGGGPAGLAAAAEAGAAGHEVVLLERSGRLGGQVALAGAAPMHVELARTLARNYSRLLEAAGVEVRLETRPIARPSPRSRPTRSSLPPGRRRTIPISRSRESRPCRPGTCFSARGPAAGAWSSPTGAGTRPASPAPSSSNSAGNYVTVAVGSAAVAETLHQYQRNLYAARLYRAGVRLEHHVELTGAEQGRVFVRNLFAPEVESELPADLLVLALGRVPDRALVAALTGVGLEVYGAGDCLGPRGLEEAILEGTLAAQAAGDGSSSR